MTKTPHPPRQGSAEKISGTPKSGKENFQSVSLTLWRLQNLHEALTEQASQLFATAAEVEAKAAHLTQRLRNRQKTVSLPPLALEADFEDMELRLEAFGARITSYRQQMVNGPITQKRLDDMASRTSELEEKLRRFKTKFTAANERLENEYVEMSTVDTGTSPSDAGKRDNIVRFSASVFPEKPSLKGFEGTAKQPRKLFSLAAKLKGEVGKRSKIDSGNDSGHEDKKPSNVVPFSVFKKD